MILTSELDTLDSINEMWLRESLERKANGINSLTDTHVEVYNNKPNHFIIVVDNTLEYILNTTDYTAELIQHVSPLQDKTLLVAVADDSNNFEEILANRVIHAVYRTL